MKKQNELKALFSIMDNHSTSIVLFTDPIYGNPTASDIQFMELDSFTLPSSSRPSPLPSMSMSMSDEAQSAPTNVSQLLDELSRGSADLLHVLDKKLPTAWNMPDFVLAVLGNDPLLMPDHLQSIYYDLTLRGKHSWFGEEFLNLLALIQN